MGATHASQRMGPVRDRLSFSFRRRWPWLPGLRPRRESLGKRLLSTPEVCDVARLHRWLPFHSLNHTTDLDAIHLFVPIRHIWLMGEYAGRIAEWGSEAVPAEWLAKQVDILQAWEDEKLSPGLCKSLPCCRSECVLRCRPPPSRSLSYNQLAASPSSRMNIPTLGSCPVRQPAHVH